MDISKIKLSLAKELGWKPIECAPKYLEKYRWAPKLIFYETTKKQYIAIDIVFNQLLSQRIYEKEALVALKENKNLSICLLIPSQCDRYLLKSFCQKNKIGLKVFGSFGISTVVPLPFETVSRIKIVKAKKEGWFPQVILDEVKKVSKINYALILKEMVGSLEKNKTEEKQYDHIRKYLDKIFKSHPDFIGDSTPFLKLLNFENILKYSGVNNRDHVLHSVRVFMIGCIVIDRFYEEFKQCYKDIFPGIRTINLEYIWFLASLFHDVGRIRQKSDVLLRRDPNGENKALDDAIEREMSKAWEDADYQFVLSNVVSLIEQCCSRKEDREPFTGCDMNDEVDQEISTVLTESYNKRISHGVISCFELVPDLLKKIKASKIKPSNTFLKYHILPAAVAVALHDWTIWGDLEKLKIFPIKFENFPIASLLIYIDTWDDFKRSAEAKVSIDKIRFDAHSVTVYITWHKKNEYLEEKIKYTSFEKNIKFSKLKFKIKITNEI